MIRRLWTRPYAPLAPEQPFTAIGDIHGRDDLLKRALEGLAGPVICVGDYVDRGPRSADVLARLQSRPDITCLMGNHEEMLLAFLDDPQAHGPRWLRYGGVQTLESFGLKMHGEPAEDQSLTSLRDAFRDALGAPTETWLRALPSIWRSGNVAVTHAGADPALPLETQSDRALRWGHRDFTKRRRTDGQWVIRGHVIVGEAQAKDGVISIDTGAYATGRLTLAEVTQGAVQFTEIIP